MSPIEEALALKEARKRLPNPATRKLIRERAGVSQRAVAAELGIYDSSICRWESGEDRVGDRNLVRYLNLLRRLAEVAGLEALIEAEAADDGRRS